LASSGHHGPFTLRFLGRHHASFGFDFNPTVDRIRVVSNTGQNLRLHPVTGVVASTDTPLTFAATDLNGFDIAPSGLAYAVLKVTGKDQPKHTCGNSDLYTIYLTSRSQSFRAGARNLHHRGGVARPPGCR
jgi:hypothetical protein